MSTVAVIDYGMGNLHSITKALQHVSKNTEVIVTHDHAKILAADRVVFPGVGAIRDCMKALNRTGLNKVIHHAAAQKPLLGICLGMQALLGTSEENKGVKGLGLFDGHVHHFPKKITDDEGKMIKVPHMGWNQVKQHAHPLWHNIPDESRFYFVHSYYAIAFQKNIIAATSDYLGNFTCALAKKNVFAVQFHPEKSQRVGLQLLQNFLQWQGEST